MTDTRSARILTLLALADEAPEADELAEFLTDPEPDVRRTALTVLSEATEDWANGSTQVAAALLDPDASVRRTGIELLAELREVLVAGEEFTAALRCAGQHVDPAVRTAAIGTLWRHHRATALEAADYLGDPEPAVRAEAVLALVSLRAAGPLERAAADPAAEVRAAVARELGSSADPHGASTLTALANDEQTTVAAAAFTALAETGCPPPAAALATEALRHRDWPVREAAAKALAAAPAELAATPLTVATGDENLDVRKAAVRSLGHLAPDHLDVTAALRTATDDPDADVRAYARQALLRYPQPTER
ncbi:MAG TPA: HEAT repeat domain-containing protein [Pseudonocardia sp.]|nr:HEAT repeat domain-containing protein [Pseudonocardia sp.]